MEVNDGVEVIEIFLDEDGDEDGDVLEDDFIKVFIVDNDDEEVLVVFFVDEDISDNDYESDDSGWSGKFWRLGWRLLDGNVGILLWLKIVV